LKERDIHIYVINLTETGIKLQTLTKAIKEQKYEEVDGQMELVSGYRGAGLEGSSRSGRKHGPCRHYYLLCLLFNGCTIFIVKRTTNSKLPCNDDFKRRLDDFKTT
jgi:hypothetical protein